MKLKAGNVVLAAVFAVGLFLLLYPSVSDWWNAAHQSQIVESYVSGVESLSEKERAELLKDAQRYNENLLGLSDRWHPTDAVHERYLKTLDPLGDGVMCYVEIPKINVRLPVYHGVGDDVLQAGVGHLEGSSLPVGGTSTHAVLSGHRGLPSARLLSDIDQLVEGDHFMIHVLDKTLTYEVDQIRIVEPDELEDLEIVEGEDLCTLVTCTPYGVNTHRLLVRGHRVPNDPDALAVEAEAQRIDPMKVAPLIAAPILIALFCIVLWKTRGPRAPYQPKHASSSGKDGASYEDHHQ